MRKLSLFIFFMITTALPSDELGLITLDDLLQNSQYKSANDYFPERKQRYSKRKDTFDPFNTQQKISTIQELEKMRNNLVNWKSSQPSMTAPPMPIDLYDSTPQLNAPPKAAATPPKPVLWDARIRSRGPAPVYQGSRDRSKAPMRTYPNQESAPVKIQRAWRKYKARKETRAALDKKIQQQNLINKEKQQELMSQESARRGTLANNEQTEWKKLMRNDQRMRANQSKQQIYNDQKSFWNQLMLQEEEERLRISRAELERAALATLPKEIAELENILLGLKEIWQHPTLALKTEVEGFLTEQRRYLKDDLIRTGQMNSDQTGLPDIPTKQKFWLIKGFLQNPKAAEPYHTLSKSNHALIFLEIHQALEKAKKYSDQSYHDLIQNLLNDYDEQIWEFCQSKNTSQTYTFSMLGQNKAHGKPLSTVWSNLQQNLEIKKAQLAKLQEKEKQSLAPQTSPWSQQTFTTRYRSSSPLPPVQPTSAGPRTKPKRLGTLHTPFKYQ